MPTKTQPCRTGKHHGPEGRTESKICVSRGRNVPSEISYKKQLYVSHTFLNAGYWLAASCCTAAVALTATDAAGTLEKNSIRAAAAAGAADPSKRRFPARKPHATERRQRLLLLCPQRHSPAGRGNTMALKDERSPKYTYVSRGRNVPSEISYKKLAIRFSRLAADSLLAAALLPLRLLLLRLLVSAAAY